MEEQLDIIPTKSFCKADWQRFNAEWEQSGLTQQVFCKQKRIGFHAFSHWRGCLRHEKRQTMDKNKFKPVTVKPISRTQSSRPGATTPMVIKLPNGISLQIPPQATKSQIADLLELLGVTCS